MTLRRYGPGEQPVVVTQAERDRLATDRPSARKLDADGVRRVLRRAWSLGKPPPPPNPVTGERPGYEPPS